MAEVARQGAAASDLGFGDGPLDFMAGAGAVAATWAHVWVCAGRPGEYAVCWSAENGARAGREGEEAFTVAADGWSDRTAVVRLDGLDPLTRYRFRVVAADDGETVAEGRFETAPARPEDVPRRFSFGLMSCHQPFDSDGRVRPQARQMLSAARQCLHDHEARYVLMAGDQMYSDYPEGFSLFDPAYAPGVLPNGARSVLDCSVEQVRRVYQQRYRTFWNEPEWQRLQAEFPCYPMFDDHDIVDNWGSREDHATARWRDLGDGARRAFYDYQAARVFGPDGNAARSSYHYAFAYGSIATFVMDLRSQRRAGGDGRLYGSGQFEALRGFLDHYRDAAALFVVFTVPVIHLPRFLVRVLRRLPHSPEDFADRWSARPHTRDRDRVLALLHDHQRRHPAQRLVLLSGDIHIGCLHRIEWSDGTRPLHQLVSSPITHETGRAVQLAGMALMYANRTLATQDGDLTGRIRFVHSEAHGLRRNPCGGLNLGIVEVNRADDAGPPTLRMMLYGHRDGEPVCAYRSPPL